MKDDKEIRKLKEGDSFGEQALYINNVRSSSVIAKGNVACMAISRDTISSVFGKNIENVFYKNIVTWNFEKNEILKKITKIQIERIFESMVIELKKRNEVLFQVATELKSLIVILY